MTAPAGDDWNPDPRLLAAYLDGELHGRPELDALRRRIENWLEEHPEAQEGLVELRRLGRLYQETVPVEPAPATWDALLARIERNASRRATPPQRVAGRWILALVGAAACIALFAWSMTRHSPRPVPAPTVEDSFPVATAAEVEILRVEGNDTPTLVVGRLPLQGPLELAGPGEVVLTSVQPDDTDRMLPHVRTGGSDRPMIWARVEAEEEP